MLTSIRGPQDLRRLSGHQLTELCAEMRQFVVSNVTRTGGHLGSNLGVVELTVALHRVFDSPRDRILFDTGHQAYIHKLVTGRQDFTRLRQVGGISGYPSRSESEHDLVENSHASTALSYAEGLAKAHVLLGQHDRSVVVVVGDGALTGGLAWEALNNLAGQPGLAVVIVINDNAHSYSPTIGGIANHLAALAGRVTDRSPVPVRHESVFAELGLEYLGPVDGHDLAALEDALRAAAGLRRPVVVHCLTRKGKGYPPAEQGIDDHLHAVGVVDPRTGRPSGPVGATWTDVMSRELEKIGHERADVVAVTAAMLRPTGLDRFRRSFPDRVFDVGIAEQHAVVSAAGLALGGLHPVVAVYSTFLNRAFDQVLLDVAMHRHPVTFLLDRAGITGEDGASHHGVWDTAVLSCVPHLRIAAPRDPRRLRELLREAVADSAGPTVVRFPKAPAAADIEAVGRLGGVDVLHRPVAPDVLLVGVGPMASIALDAARELADRGIRALVVDPRWIAPVPVEIVDLAGSSELVVTVEDSSRSVGFGAAVAQALHDGGVLVPCRNVGVPAGFLGHGKRSELLTELRLTGSAVAADVHRWLTAPSDFALPAALSGTGSAQLTRPDVDPASSPWGTR